MKNELTAFDMAFRKPLTVDLHDVLTTALHQGRVMCVSNDSPAATLAERADMFGAEVVSVVTSQQQVVGYIFPGWVARQVTAKVSPASNLVEAVIALANKPLPPNRTHLHEWLNFDRPEPWNCPGNGQPHDTFFKPCLEPGH